jgi:hypothetical protein
VNAVIELQTRYVNGRQAIASHQRIPGVRNHPVVTQISDEPAVAGIGCLTSTTRAIATSVR